MLRILSVGQCAYDHGRISRTLEREYQVRVDDSETFDDAIAALRSQNYDLILVNRITDLDGSPGLDLIRTIKSDPGLSDRRVMLVSNLADAQTEAVSLGALPGFGKSELAGEKLRRILDPVLATAR